MPREVHIASMIVHARPERLTEVSRKISEMGLEIHQTNPDGKLIVTQETHSTGALGETLTALQLLDGVLAATMVFHHYEPAEEFSEASGSEPEPREVQP
ncbi:chaperone NapD [Marivita sp.]|uniref:chaperone NapD n=1 Tax=Marivita sp. TaxID=2003365 RepID=UPI0025BAD489|nr:chaperone NapD [Marivita sp.]